MQAYTILLSLAALVALSFGYPLEEHHFPQEYHQQPQQQYEDNYEHHEPLPYDFKYSVEDPKTGDSKTHHESREGGVVKGFYTLKEADGTIREVHYTADKHNGFNAVVKKIGTPIPYHPQPVQHESQPQYEQHYDHVEQVHEPPQHYNWQ